jgi:drug/metabolite transporter (DMT)-like permease
MMETGVKKQTRAEITLLAMTFIWGGTFPLVKIGMEYVSPVALIALRFLLGTAVLLTFFSRRIFPLSRDAIVKGSLLSLFLFLGFVAQNIGLTITTASKSAFITGTMVVFVPLLQYVVERKAPRMGNIIGVLIVTGGLWLLTSPEGAALNAGDALSIVCAILFAVYIVYLDVVSNDMTPLQLLFLQMASTAVYALVAVWVFERPVVTVTPTSLAVLAYLTLLATLLTTYVQTRFQKDTTPARAVVIFSVEPVIAAVASYLFLGEQLGLIGVFGGALIIAGVLVSELSDSIVQRWTGSRLPSSP